jgi:DNA-binding XRE family transcriptional regulator
MSEIAPHTINPLELPSLPLEWKAALPLKCRAIYMALSAEGEILYVGRSNDIRKRWKSHDRFKHLKQIQGVRIAWIEVSDPYLLRTLETALIEYFKPEFNDPKYASPTPQKKGVRVGILNLRKRLHLTQRQVARVTGVTEQTISNWEVGLWDIKLSIKQTLNLCNVLQCTLEELVAASEEIEPADRPNSPSHFDKAQ